MTTARRDRRALLKPLALVSVAAAVLALVLTQGQPAHAATFTVTKTADTNDGVCDADCSLREATGAANALPGADTVTVPAGTYTLSIAGAGENANATGDLDITDIADLAINGAGAATTIIQACDSSGGPCTGIDRVFDIFAGANVAISGMTMQNGSSGEGGGLHNHGPLTLNSSTVSGNSSAVVGGGIRNHNTLTLNSSSVSGNSAGDSGGGIESSNAVSLTLNSSTVSGNTAGGSGGGGIFNAGTLTVNNSTISGNTAFFGGGIRHIIGTATLNNSTISGNTATFQGGGIENDATMELSNSTVSGNTVTFQGGFNSGGIHSGFTTVKNTIVANNTTSNCGGPITSAGHNLSSDATCSFTATGDMQNTNPMLGPLADNGGPTQTHALLAASPAIDAGSSDCPPPATDQRGVARPQGAGAACDIGAYERVLVISVQIDIKPGGDPNSFKCDSRGNLPVAILGSASFDATTVAVATVTLEAAVDTINALSKSLIGDVNSDGFPDIVVYFANGEVAAEIGCPLAKNTVVAVTVRGQTSGGVSFAGSDVLRIAR